MEKKKGERRKQKKGVCLGQKRVWGKSVADQSCAGASLKYVGPGAHCGRKQKGEGRSGTKNRIMYN